jgi:hypothetical protein
VRFGVASAGVAALIITWGAVSVGAQDDFETVDGQEVAEEAVDESMLQPRKLVDAHTAGILPRASFDFECRIYPSGDPRIDGGGLLVAIAVGISHRLSIGISYGGDGLVGRGRDVRGNPYPGGMIKYRLIEEGYVMPGLAIGYEHQGYGGVDEREGLDGFVYKSQGFFLALSKSFLLFRRIGLGLHGALNYSMEEIDEVTWPNAYVGLDLGFNEELALAIEYDLGFNVRDPETRWDPIRKYYGNPLRGLLNVGLRWAFSPSFYIEALAKDVLENRYDEERGRPVGWTRELKLVYVKIF